MMVYTPPCFSGRSASYSEIIWSTAPNARATSSGGMACFRCRKPSEANDLAWADVRRLSPPSALSVSAVVTAAEDAAAAVQAAPLGSGCKWRSNVAVRRLSRLREQSRQVVGAADRVIIRSESASTVCLSTVSSAVSHSQGADLAAAVHAVSPGPARARNHAGATRAAPHLGKADAAPRAALDVLGCQGAIARRGAPPAGLERGSLRCLLRRLLAAQCADQRAGAAPIRRAALEASHDARHEATLWLDVSVP